MSIFLDCTNNTFHMSFKQEIFKQQQLKRQPGERSCNQSKPVLNQGLRYCYSLTRHPDQSRAICLPPRLVPELLRPATFLLRCCLSSRSRTGRRTQDGGSSSDAALLMDELSSRDCAHFTHPAGNSNPNPIYYSLGYCLTV